MRRLARRRAARPVPRRAQTVSYVPQVSYRTVYYNTPVVAYRPTPACGLFGPTTVMRPMTTYVTAARLVPYTSYRPVVAAYAPACPSPCATGACGACAPGGGGLVLRSGGRGCCSGLLHGELRRADHLELCSGRDGRLRGPGSGAQTYSPAPAAAPTPLGTPGSSFQSQPPASAYPSNPAPSQPQPSEQTQPNQTFENPSGQPAPEPQSRIVLPPRTTNSTTSGVPRSLDPEDALDQSTAIPLRRSVAMRPVSTASAPQSTDLSDQGWRSARKQ